MILTSRNNYESYESYNEDITSRMKISPNEGKILGVLFEQTELISTSDLAEKSNISLNNISRYIKSLEKKGLVNKKTVQEGKTRFIFISLTSRNNYEPYEIPKDIGFTSRNTTSSKYTGRKGESSVDLVADQDLTPKKLEAFKSLYETSFIDLMSELEKEDFKTLLNHYIISYRVQVMKHPSGEASRKMKRFLKYYEQIFGKPYVDEKYDEFNEWISNNYSGVAI